MMKTNKIFYTDGSCLSNPGLGGYGVVLFEGDSCKELISERSDGITTNNREELKAIIRAFEIITEKYPEEKCIIYSDSAYAVNMINNWIYGWARNGWQNSKKREVENIDLVKEIYKYLNIDFFTCQVFIEKIKGHNGAVGNEIADALATADKDKLSKLINSNQIQCDLTI